MTTTPPGSTPGPTTPGTPAGGVTPAPATTPAPTSPSTGSAASPVDTLVRGAMDAARQAREHLARAAGANRGRIVSSADKLGRTVDSRTNGRYHRYVQTATSWVAKGVDVVAGMPGATAGTGLTGAPSTGPHPTPGAPLSGAPTTAPTQPASGTAAKPREGWHRGPDGQWVKTS